MNTGALWVRGTGKFHLRADGSTETVCGRKVPDNPQIAVYSMNGCFDCKRKAPELAQVAELQRKRDYEERIQRPLDDRLAANRAGRFVVLRCRLCGQQHARSGDGHGAVAWCQVSMHVAEVEAVEVTGPAWNPEAPATWSDGSTDPTTRAFDCLADLAAMPLHDDGDEAA